MSGLELALVVAAVVWLSLLTFVILLLVRQIGLITVRLDRERDDARPVSDGLEMGSEVPAQVAELIEPGEAESPAFVLVLAAICNPCRDLLEGLDGFAPRSPIVALVSGPEAPARALAETIPPYITAVRDPEARPRHPRPRDRHDAVRVRGARQPRRRQGRAARRRPFHPLRPRGGNRDDDGAVEGSGCPCPIRRRVSGKTRSWTCSSGVGSSRSRAQP